MFGSAGGRAPELDDEVVDEPAAFAIAAPPMSAAATAAALTSEDLMFLMSLLTSAMVLASASVGFGLTMGGRLIKRGALDRRTIHEVLSLSTTAAIVIHDLALLGDTYFKFSLLKASAALLAPYKNLFASIGIIACWGIFVLGLSCCARRRIGHARWMLIHRFTALAWLLGLLHTLTVGSDAGRFGSSR